MLSSCDIKFGQGYPSIGGPDSSTTGESNNSINDSEDSSLSIYEKDEEGYICYNKVPYTYKDDIEYYSSIQGLKGEQLRAGLYKLIRGHDTIRYDGISGKWKEMYKEIDKDPLNDNGINMLYSGVMNNNTTFDREHVWPKSIGFPDYTKLDPGIDLHNLHPALSGINSYRSDNEFDDIKDGSYNPYYEYTYKKDAGVFQPKDESKGDIARTIFYMAIRYEGKEKVDGIAKESPNLEVSEEIGKKEQDGIWYLGRLSTLLKWNIEDPVDASELLRNETIYSKYQHNRNPFIDHPEYVNMIFDSSYQGEGATIDKPTSKNENIPLPPNSGKSDLYNGNVTSSSIFTSTVSGATSAYKQNVALKVSNNDWFATSCKKSSAFTLGINNTNDRIEEKYYSAIDGVDGNTNASALAMNFDVSDSNAILFNIAEFYPSTAPDFLKDFKSWHILKSVDGGTTYTEVKRGTLLDVEFFQIGYVGPTENLSRYTLVIEGVSARLNIVRVNTLKDVVI